MSGSPLSGLVPLSVSFDGSGSSDPDGDLLVYAWDLDGDGQFDDSSQVSPSWVYQSAGQVTVSLRVTDPDGGSDTDSVTVDATSGGGGDGFVTLPGASGNYITAPDSSGLDVTGDIDLRADVSLDDWSTSYAKLINKFGSAYELLLDNGSSSLRMAWRTASGSLRFNNSTVPLPVVDGQRLQVRATLDVDNGAGGHRLTFYYRTDPTRSLSDHSGWTQLGAVINGAGVSSIQADTTNLALGSNPVGSSRYWAGNYYQALVLNGIGAAGTVVANPDFRTTGQLTSTPPNYSQWTDTANNPWTINGTNWTYTPG